MDIKDRITQKSGELFISYGIKNVSVDEIASSMGVSKRTIYENFKDKEDILLECLKMFYEQKRNDLRESEEKSNNVIDLFLNTGAFSEAVRKIPSIKFFEDIEKYYPRGKQYIANQKQENFDLTKMYIERGVREGVFRDNLNVEIAAFIVHDTHSYTFTRAAQFDAFPFSHRELFFTMVINFIRGISTEKGIKIIDDYLKNNPYKP
ncbi:MAG: TetR/AcrR family transcriptional regulator [Dysgonamonadaceae bacterium]|jgi:AcrR family transcriptional regulator|nr:TetR/AcrR family transcriptional regulator [Dysgonamonadaceae bacterium]